MADQVTQTPLTPVRNERVLDSPQKFAGTNNLSPASYSSVSTANTNGTAVHHKSTDTFGIKSGAERGYFREHGMVFTQPSKWDVNEEITVLEDSNPKDGRRRF
jgi:hypothetical protein